MATYYVGPTAAGLADGSSWANRYGSFNDAEDTPVAAGDTVIGGPGVYRETLTVDVSGAPGNEITYVADVTGEHTDGVGGIVRIASSDNDQTSARTMCIDANAKDYRTFRGFYMDFASLRQIYLQNSCTNWVIEDCIVECTHGTGIELTGDSTSNIDLLRCLFLGGQYGQPAIYFNCANGNCAAGITNCFFLGGVGQSVLTRSGGLTIHNCTLYGGYTGIYVWAALPGGYTTITVENCILNGLRYGLNAMALGEITENFNAFSAVAVPRTNVAVGANSNTYPPILLPPILHSGANQASGYEFPWWFGKPSGWSQVRAIAGNAEPAVDLRGVGRPATASKNSWGALQWQGEERDTATTHDASTASLELPDAGRAQFKIPVDGAEITVSVYVQREANYAGTNPQMIIKQPSQADRTTTDAGAAGAWNELADTFTPVADPEYIFVELVSNNSAVAGNYAVYFDDLSVDASPALGTFDEWFTDRIVFDEVAAGGGGTAAPIMAPSTIVR